MLSRKGIPQGEWRLHPESVRMIWTRYGAAEVDLFATSSRMHIACCSSPCLTPRWRGTRWHRTGQQPGCIYIFKKKRGASVILIAPNWPTQLGSRTRQSCWWHRPDQSPSGRICYLRWAARGGTRTRSCGAFMCGCFGDIRGAECPAFSCARHALGGADTLYEAFVCSEMGSVWEIVPLCSYRPGCLLRVGCSAFSTVQIG